MIPALIDGWNRTFKGPGDMPECGDLRVRVQRYDVSPERSVFAFTSAWEPTPAELAALNAGAKLHLTIIGMTHPPVELIVEGAKRPNGPGPKA